ncbi:hypothetical protein [Streptomyces sp. NPDC001985]|uniref:hypothetical protein n=1 Tax=Streptomyces sp. NPDC001985 TaxID=3154406 RepID=UPI00331A1583
MQFSPTLYIGEVLVVLEGPARVRWQGPGTDRRTPVGVWPDAGQLAAVREHLDSERPLLVLLDEARSRVPVLREEWPSASCRLLREPGGDDEVAEFRLPFLDWLPGRDRERAARFLAESDETLSRTPVALLPPLMIEGRPDGAPRNPRFARRLLPGTLTPARLTAAVDHLLAGEGAGRVCAAGAAR